MDGSEGDFGYSSDLLVCKSMEWPCQCAQASSKRKIWIAIDWTIARELDQSSMVNGDGDVGISII